jgi:hypothetical protein
MEAGFSAASNSKRSTRSVTGASSFARVMPVSAISNVSGGIKRQIPSRVSKKSLFLKVRLRSRSITQASPLGRTAYIKSHGGGQSCLSAHYYMGISAALQPPAAWISLASNPTGSLKPYEVSVS